MEMCYKKLSFFIISFSRLRLLVSESVACHLINSWPCPSTTTDVPTLNPSRVYARKPLAQTDGGLPGAVMHLIHLRVPQRADGRLAEHLCTNKVSLLSIRFAYLGIAPRVWHQRLPKPGRVLVRGKVLCSNRARVSVIECPPPTGCPANRPNKGRACRLESRLRCGRQAVPPRLPRKSAPFPWLCGPSEMEIGPFINDLTNDHLSRLKSAYSCAGSLGFRHLNGTTPTA